MAQCQPEDGLERIAGRVDPIIVATLVHHQRGSILSHCYLLFTKGPA